MKYFCRVIIFHPAVMLKAVSIPDMTMSTKINTTRQDRVKTAFDSLRVARIFQRDRQIYGIARVNRYVEDVDGDWLEKWGEDKEDNHYTSRTPIH